MTETEKLHADLKRFRDLRASTDDARTLAVLTEFIETTYERLRAIAVVANDR
jgi:hypothetical protein